MLRLQPSDPRSPRRHVLVTLACLGLAGYFAHHAVNGRHGLEARQRLLATAPQIERQLVAADEARTRLRHEVGLLSLDVPGSDLVEEIARDVLGYVLPSEVVWLGR